MNRKAIENIRLYGVAPTWDHVALCLKKMKLSMHRFETVFKVPHSTLKQYKYKTRELPAIYWHLFYEAFDPSSYRVFKKKIKLRQKAGTGVGTDNQAVRKPKTPVKRKEKAHNGPQTDSAGHTKLDVFKGRK